MIDHTQPDVGTRPDRVLDELSMRVLELGVASLAIAAAMLMSIAR